MRNTTNFPSENYTSPSLSVLDTIQEKVQDEIRSSLTPLAQPPSRTVGHQIIFLSLNGNFRVCASIIQYHDEFVMRVLWPIFMILHPF